MTPRQTKTNFGFWTIGYEGLTIDNYLNKLIENDVRVLCDLRKNPISRKKGFSKTTLSKALNDADIKYIHFPELGIESSRRKQVRSEADYHQLFEEYRATTLKENQASLLALIEIFEKYHRLAITCFEADHEKCHRNQVAEALVQYHKLEYKIQHL